MAKNPVLQKKYEQGFKVGYDKGFIAGIQQSTCFFASKFDGLENVKGIGEKTLKKIQDQLGKDYFVQPQKSKSHKTVSDNKNGATMKKK